MEYLDLTQDFPSSKAIRVAVIPVGEVPYPKYKYYFDIINSMNVCEMIELPHEYTSAPFPNRTYNDWKQGKIYFTFDSVYSKEDLNELNKDEWGYFRGNRRVLGVVGIVMCEQFPDLSVAVNEFTSIVQQHFKNNAAVKCFAFHPLRDQPDLERGNFIMIPNEEATKIQFYVKIQIMDFASSILKVLEKFVLETNHSDISYISTPHDSEKTIDEITKLKKLKAARITKMKGDYCLLCGSPKDAQSYYNLAIDQLKSNNDFVWVGVALEGIAAFLILFEHPNQQSEEEKEHIFNEIVNTVTDAISNYSKKGALNLVLECTFKLARYYISVNKKKEVSDLIMETYDLTKDLSIHNQAVFTANAAMLFREIGFMRKFAFFIRETAICYHQTENSKGANNLLRLIAKYYHLESLDESYSALSRRTRNPFSEEKGIKNNKKGEWPFLQKLMLQNLIKTSKASLDFTSNLRYSVFMLKSMGSTLIDTVQKLYYDDFMYIIKSLASSGFNMVDIDMTGIPQLKKISPYRLPKNLNPIPLKKENNSKGFKWLYSPHEQTKRDEEIRWAKGEICQVLFEFSNPYVFEIEIHKAELCTQNVEFEAYPISFTIPPKTTSFEVVLSGKALEAGELEIIGCLLNYYGLQCLHPINSQGVGISLKDFYDENSQKKPISIINKITIVPSLPLLLIQETSASSERTLFEGESFICVIEIKNISSERVDRLNLKIEEKKNQIDSTGSLYDIDEEEEEFQLDRNLISKDLPLLAGQKIQLPIVVKAKRNSSGADFNFTYGSEECLDYNRNFILLLPLNISLGLQVSEIDVISMQGGIPEGYCNQDMCAMVAVIVNPTNRTFNLSCYSTSLQTNSVNEINLSHSFIKEIILEPHAQKRLVIPLKKFTLDKNNIPPLREQKGQYIKKKEIPEEEEKKMRLLYWYQSEISKKIYLKWKCQIYNTQGMLPLFNRLLLTTQMLSSIETNFVTVKFVTENYTSGVKYLPIHEFKTMIFQFENRTNIPLTLSATINPLQDQENGSQQLNNGAGGKFIWIGSLDRIITKLEPFEKYDMELDASFLERGIYKFLVQAKDIATQRSHSETFHVHAQ